MDQPIWQPSEERIGRANMTAFARQVAAAHGERLRDYPALRAWSVEHSELFWPALWRFAEVRASRPWRDVLVDGDRMPGARWFVGAELNFAENLLRHRHERPAIIAWSEDGRRRELSYSGLYQEVAKLAAALRRDGIGPGDRVAAVMPHAAQTIIVMLATTALGAIWSSCSPDFGVQGVLDRFGQIEPKVLITIDGYRYNGKAIDVRDKLAEITGRLPSLERVVMVPFLQPAPAPGPLGAVLYDDFVVQDPGPMLWGGELVLRDGSPVGQVTSAAWGETVGASVGLAYVRRDEPVTSDWLEAGGFRVDVGGERFDARLSLTAPLA